MDTEFAARLHSENPEKKDGIYAAYKVKPLILQFVYYWFDYSDKNNLSIFSLLWQSLEAKDIVSAIAYVLSAPPHVQVCNFHFYNRFLTHWILLCNIHNITSLLIIIKHYLTFLSDWRHSHWSCVAQVTEVVPSATAIFLWPSCFQNGLWGCYYHCVFLQSLWQVASCSLSYNLTS